MSKEEFSFLKEIIPEDEHFRINSYLAILTIGQKEKIKFDKDYLLHWDLDNDNHTDILTYVSYLSEELEDSSKISLLSPFIESLKNCKPINKRIKTQIKCKGLSIISFSSIIYTLWKNDVLLSDKNDFKKFITGLFSKIYKIK